MTTRHILGFESWPYTRKDEGEALKELERLSDRAAGIVATTLLENSLDQALIYGLANKDDALMKEIFNEAGPLSSFASKIKLALAMGLTTVEGRRDLDTIRRIRNAFAHRLVDSTFQSDSIKDRCLSLKLVDDFVSFGAIGLSGAYVTFHPGSKVGFCFPGMDPNVLKDPRTRFFLTVNHFISNLRVRSPRPEAPRPYF